MTTGDKLHRVMQEKIAELGLDAAQGEAAPSDWRDCHHAEKDRLKTREGFTIESWCGRCGIITHRTVDLGGVLNCGGMSTPMTQSGRQEAGPSREALMQVFRAATLWAYQFREGERAGDAATLLLLQLTRCESESGGSNG